MLEKKRRPAKGGAWDKFAMLEHENYDYFMWWGGLSDVAKHIVTLGHRAFGMRVILRRKR